MKIRKTILYTLLLLLSITSNPLLCMKSDSESSDLEIEKAIAMSQIDPREDTCGICLEPLENDTNKEWIITDCLHYFHKSCLDQWFEQGGGTCPNCRILLNEEAESFKEERSKVEQIRDDTELARELDRELNGRRIPQGNLLPNIFDILPPGTILDSIQVTIPTLQTIVINGHRINPATNKIEEFLIQIIHR